VENKQKEAEIQRVKADEFAEKVGHEKTKVEAENEKAKIQQEECGVIKENVEASKK
jgi:hypothetical protein